MPGYDRQTFTFAASEVTGAANIAWIEGIFSIAGDDTTGAGGPSNGGACWFFYYASPQNVLYLYEPVGGDVINVYGPTVVGPGGTDLVSAYCTIHAGSPSSHVATEPNILDLTLDIDFAPSSGRRHMYVITRNNSAVYSFGGNWKYWGWWQIP